VHLFAHEGELVFAMGGRHDGLYMETPVPFKLKLKGPGPGGASTAAPSQLQQNSTSEMQEHQQHHHDEEMEEEEEVEMEAEQTQQEHHEDREEDEDEEEQKEQGHKVRMSSSTVCDGVNNEDDEDDEDDDDEQPSGAGSAPTIDGGSVPGTASTNGSERNGVCATIPHLSERGSGQRSAEDGNAKVSVGGSGSGSDTAQSGLEDDPLGHTNDDSSDRSADDESYAQDAKETAEVFHDAVEAEDVAFDGGRGGDQEPAPPTTTTSSSSCSGLLSVSGNALRPDAAPSSSLLPVPGPAPSSQVTSSPLPESAPSSSLALGEGAAAAAGTRRPRRRRRDHDEGDTPNTGPSAGAESLHPPAARDGMPPRMSEAAAATATMGRNSKKARK
jgi:hypothetical protein